MCNQVENAEYAIVRDHLHDVMLAEMDRIRDPFRSFRWASRSWRRSKEEFYWE